MTLQLYHLPVPGWLADRGIDELGVWSVPLTMRFRRILVREGMVLHGPAGWGEWSPFWDYDAQESSTWLRAGVEAATVPMPPPRREKVCVNVTVPVTSPQRAWQIVTDSGCRTAKVKVADPGTSLAEDCARLEAVRDAIGSGQIRVDANASWDVEQARRAIDELDRAAGGLEYVEQPCSSVPELAQVRRVVEVPIAADESVRRAEDPLAVARAQAADILIVKVQPLGGVRRATRIVEQAGLPAVVSSALDTSIGIGMATQLAGQMEQLDHACGLGTVRLFDGDLATPSLLPRDGTLPVGHAEVSPTAWTDGPTAQTDGMCADDAHDASGRADSARVGDAGADLRRRWAQRLDATIAVLRSESGRA